MKTLTVRLPDRLVADLDAESRRRSVSRSDVVRERLESWGSTAPATHAIERVADLIGTVDGLPPDLSTRKKVYLKTTGYGRKRPR